MTAEITLRPSPGLAQLERVWCELESRADASFFQSWAWVGCLAEQRFDRPWLLEARQGREVVALALCNHRRGTLLLNETGRRGWDAVFVEHNGILAALGVDDQRTLRASCLRALARRRLVLSGVDDAHLQAARDLPGFAQVRQTRRAPWADLTKPGPYLDTLSANTRYQIRRSDRTYGDRGPLRIERAETVADAHRFLGDLAVLHQRTWRSRGRPGAFANPDFVRFHHALIDRTMPGRAIDLLRITAGGTTVGYLHNFVHRGRVSAYQSGFDYATAGPHGKPGLTSHRLAIEMYRSEGMTAYDFLAGDDRYKTSLATASAALHWIEYAPRFSAAWLAARARHLLGR